jgi:TPP-dependent pyruvate/acetoin dehydrogenase alpha subunit
MTAPGMSALAAYERMALIRAFEQRVLELFAQGALAGTTHTSLGQEAIAVGVLSQLDPGDVVFSNHRCHGHYLARFDDPDGLLAELMGRADGPCGGVGGSQHLHRENFYTNGILGGTVPCAAGMALAERRRGSGRLAAVFLGDGALGEGVVYETLNLASLWQLPLLFVVEANGVAQSTPTGRQLAGDMLRRAEAFGVPARRGDGNDLAAVQALAGEAAARVRRGGPFWLVLDTYRLGPHSKGDDPRPAEELAAAWAREPLARLRALLPAEAARAIDARVARRIEAAVERTRAVPRAEA